MSSSLPINAAPGSLGGGNSPFWIAVKRGYFAANGLDVEVRRQPGGSPAQVRALVDGKLDFAMLGATSMLAANLDGADLVCVMGVVTKLAFQVMVQPDIKTVADLRGRTLAASKGSTDAVLWHWFLPQ